METPHQFDAFGSGSGRRPGVCVLMADALASAAASGGRVLLCDAVELAIAHADVTGRFEIRTGDRYAALWRRFGKVMEREHKSPRVCDVTEEATRVFVEAWTSYHRPASVATKRLRLSALRALFRTLRELRIASTDPSIDVDLPSRVTDLCRPFTDDEIERCRWHTLAATAETRRPAAWALMEAGATTVEVGLIRIADLDPADPELWIPGGPKTRPRRVPLNSWSETQLRRRAVTLGGDPDEPLAVRTAGTQDVIRNSTTALLRSVIRAASFGPDPLAGPTSITAWLAQSILTDTGRIEDVARRLGMSSLDRAARAAHWVWSS